VHKKQLKDSERMNLSTHGVWTFALMRGFFAAVGAAVLASVGSLTKKRISHIEKIGNKERREMIWEQQPHRRIVRDIQKWVATTESNIFKRCCTWVDEEKDFDSYFEVRYSPQVATIPGLRSWNKEPVCCST
jgi:Na+-translocating ferredoxin:NAD+ oxidoreductase RnfG subunit